MSVARHPRPKELVGVPIEDIFNRYVGRFRDRKPDWAAFEDAKVEGFKRAQHRFIGAGGSGKHGDPTVIPAGNFTLSIMYVEPGQGMSVHHSCPKRCGKSGVSSEWHSVKLNTLGFKVLRRKAPAHRLTGLAGSRLGRVRPSFKLT